jgi:hypothetical protein
VRPSNDNHDKAEGYADLLGQAVRVRFRRLLSHRYSLNVAAQSTKRVGGQARQSESSNPVKQNRPRRILY